MLTSTLHVHRAAEMGAGDSKRHCCTSCRLQTLGDAIQEFPWEQQGGSLTSFEGSHLVIGYPYCSRDINPKNILMESHAFNMARDADHASFLAAASRLVSRQQLVDAGVTEVSITISPQKGFPWSPCPILRGPGAYVLEAWWLVTYLSTATCSNVAPWLAVTWECSRAFAYDAEFQIQESA